MRYEWKPGSLIWSQFECVIGVCKEINRNTSKYNVREMQMYLNIRVHIIILKNDRWKPAVYIFPHAGVKEIQTDSYLKFWDCWLSQASLLAGMWKKSRLKVIFSTRQNKKTIEKNNI